MRPHAFWGSCGQSFLFNFGLKNSSNLLKCPFFFKKVLRVVLKRRLALEFDAFIFIIILWKCFREAKIGSFSVIAGKMVYFALKWRFSPRNRCARPRNGRLYSKWRRFLAIFGAGLLNGVIYTLLAYSKM